MTGTKPEREAGGRSPGWSGDRLRTMCARAGVTASGPLQLRCLKRNESTSVTTAAIVEMRTGRYVAILKIVTRPNPAGIEALARESACLEALRRSGIPAPRLLALADKGAVLLRSWEEGATGPAKGLSLANISALASLLSGIHRIRPKPAARTLPVGDLEARLQACEENLAALASVHRSNLHSYGGRLRRLWPGAALVGLIHGDISPDNIVVAQGGEVLLIDWAEASFGPVMLDLGAVMNTVARTDRRLEAFLVRYRTGLADPAGLIWFAALDSWTRCINAASNERSYRATMRRLEDQLARASSARAAKSPKARNPESST